MKNSVVIIDEAHNLLDTISQIHSAEVSFELLEYALKQVNQYFTRYSSRFLAKNLLYIKQVIFILSRLKKTLDSAKASKLMSTYEFISECEIFNLDLIKLIKYIEKSKLAQKVGFLANYLNSETGKENEKKLSDATKKKGVSGFINEVKKQACNQTKKQAQQNVTNSGDTNEKLSEDAPCTSSTTPIIQVTSLLKALINVESEGRILILNEASTESRDGRSTIKKRIKYMLLNPSSQFTDLISECRAIVVAGGTMHPLSEFKNQLFVGGGADPSRIMHFSCSHVVPPENVLPIGITDLVAIYKIPR